MVSGRTCRANYNWPEVGITESYYLFFDNFQRCTRLNTRCGCTSPEKRRKKPSKPSRFSIKMDLAPSPSEYPDIHVGVRSDPQKSGPNPPGRGAPVDRQ